MKKFLASLLCIIPLAASAVTIGGFEFPQESIYGYMDTSIILEKYIGNDRWCGVYLKDLNTFILAIKAKGHNKIWDLASKAKGEDYGNTRSGKIRSVLTLVEVDCNENRYRTLKIVPYTGYFLSGKVIPEGIMNETSEWEYGIKDNGYMKLRCTLLNYNK